MNASEIFKNHTGYTYDDLILMPIYKKVHK